MHFEKVMYLETIELYNWNYKCLLLDINKSNPSNSLLSLQQNCNFSWTKLRDYFFVTKKTATVDTVVFWCNCISSCLVFIKNILHYDAFFCNKEDYVNPSIVCLISNLNCSTHPRQRKFSIEYFQEKYLNFSPSSQLFIGDLLWYHIKTKVCLCSNPKVVIKRYGWWI